jgi:hypothetical protein
MAEKQTVNINSRNVSDAEQVLELTKHSLIAFGKLFLPGDFGKSKSPPFHYEIADALLENTTKSLALILPRGSAKTQLFKTFLMHKILFKESNDLLFMAWVSDNHRKSILNLQYIKQHFQTNDQIRYYFGDIVGTKWTETDIVTSTNAKLISRSNLSSVRGENYLGKRYDIVALDDTESETNTVTLDAREKIKNIVYNGVKPALDVDGRLIFAGTPVHFDSLCQNILDGYLKSDNKDDYTWDVIHYKSTQPEMQGGVLWDTYMPRKKLDRIKKDYEQAGRSNGYYQEYELEVQNEDDALFGRDYIKYWEGYYKRGDDDCNYLVIDGEDIPVNTFIGCDPATDIDTKTSDFSVIMVVAVTPENNVHILEYERHRSIPTVGPRDSADKLIGKKGVVDYIMELHQKYHCTSSTVEDVAMNRSVFQSLNERRRIENKFSIAVIPEKPPGRMDKRNKIYSGLSGRFSTGTVYLRDKMYDLEHEIITFGPKMAHDDTIETLFYALLHAFPPNMKKTENKGERKWVKPKRKARPWVVA